MKKKVEVYIPSWKRCGDVGTRDFFPEATLVVDEAEAEDYEREYGGPLMVCPPGVHGNIARVRNYIIDHATSDWILQADDDWRGIGYHEGMEQVWVKDPEYLAAFVLNGFVMAEDLGVHLWGVGQQKDPKFYKQQTPISMLAPVLGCFTAIIRTHLRYEEELQPKEDYDFFLQHVHMDHKVLRFNKWFYDVNHLVNKGGIVSYRTKEMELEKNKLLQEKWGAGVVKLKALKRKGSRNPRITIPLKGV